MQVKNIYQENVHNECLRLKLETDAVKKKIIAKIARRIQLCVFFFFVTFIFYLLMAMAMALQLQCTCIYWALCNVVLGYNGI